MNIADVMLQGAVTVKPFPAVTALVRSPVAVNAQSVAVQGAVFAETSPAQRTLVWFVSRVDSQVIGQISAAGERLVARVTSVRFLSAVSSAVNGE